MCVCIWMLDGVWLVHWICTDSMHSFYYTVPTNASHLYFKVWPILTI
jgi:hypothetical protein